MWMRLARRLSFEDQNQFHLIPSCPFGHCGLDVGEILICSDSKFGLYIIFKDVTKRKGDIKGVILFFFLKSFSFW